MAVTIRKNEKQQLIVVLERFYRNDMIGEWTPELDNLLERLYDDQ